jgi:hypothetical protein
VVGVVSATGEVVSLTEYRAHKAAAEREAREAEALAAILAHADSLTWAHRREDVGESKK